MEELWGQASWVQPFTYHRVDDLRPVTAQNLSFLVTKVRSTHLTEFEY